MRGSDLDVAAHVRMGALRWLHSIDLDPGSRTYGIADREFWAWKTKDFPNATWQSGLAGFADSYGLLGISDAQAASIVSAILAGSKNLQRSSGSFEEAYPYEDSYAVTALVLFSLLYAYYRRPGWFGRTEEKLLAEIAAPAIAFLKKTPETHGLISNHLAAGLLAAALAGKYLGIPSDSSLSTLFALQDSQEGWFPEYGSADPGYQTLLNHYLAAALALGWELDTAPLRKSVEFIAHFCFPDCSFSGEMGSRGTSIFYPSGSVLFDGGRPALSVASSWFEEMHRASSDCVCPISVDSGNFAPVFNSWALYAALSSAAARPQPEESRTGATVFRNAGMAVAWSQQGRLAVSWHNGALRKAEKKEGVFQDASVVAFTRGESSTQLSRPRLISLDESGVACRLYAAPRKQALPGPLSLAAVRAMGAAGYLCPPFHRLVKRLLARHLMGGSEAGTGTGLP